MPCKNSIFIAPSSTLHAHIRNNSVETGYSYDGFWNEAGAAVDFRLLPAWYQTGWFRTSAAIAAILFIWIIHRLRVQQVTRAVSVRSDERLAERTRMARELHDTFIQTIQGSKMVVDDALENRPIRKACITH
jgi:signal transduction histidine kinase